MKSRVEIFRDAVDAAVTADNPAADLRAVGWALVDLGRRIRSRPAGEQRALLMAAIAHASRNRSALTPTKRRART